MSAKEVSVQPHTLAALPVEKTFGTHWKGWVGPRAGLGNLEER